MKQKLFFLLVVLSFLLPVPLLAYDFESGGIYYDLVSYDNDWNPITPVARVAQSPEDNTYSGDIVIPSTVEYEGQKLPVTAIGDNAFMYCKELYSVVIPNSVLSIGGTVFYWCEKLTSIEIPNSVTSIGHGAFFGCRSLASIELPNSLDSIGDDTFGYCNSLTSIVIPSLVSSIGGNAFVECHSLKIIIIKSKNVIIHNSDSFAPWYIFAFDGVDCSGLDESGERSALIRRFDPETTIIMDDGTMLSDNGKTLYFVPVYEGMSYAVTEGVTKIVTGAICPMYGNRNSIRIIDSFSIPSTIQEIEPDAFLNTKIEKVNFTDWSKWYANVKLGNLYSNPYWNSTPYVGGVQMVTPELTDGMTEIPDYINCGLQFKNEIELPRSIKRIGAYAFYNNKELFSVILPAGLEEIGESAFEGCTLLENPSFPAGLKKIEDGAYKGCTSFTEITLPEGLTTLGSRPSGNEESDDSAAKGVFEDCPALEKAVVTVDINYLADNLFKGCGALDKVYFPLQLKTIGNSAFENCLALDEITFPATLESIGEKAFKSVDYYNWNTKGSLSKLIIPDGVRYIGREAFFYQGITNLSLGKGLERISDYAFFDNTELKVVSLSEGLREIGAYAFGNSVYSSQIGSIVLPSTITHIGDCAFSGVYISNLVIPDGVESLGPGSCGRPSVLTIGSGIKDIAADAFSFEKLYTIRLKAHMPPSLSDAFPLTSEQNDQLTLIVNKDRHDTYNTNARWKQIDRILEEGESEVEIYLDGTYSLAEEIRIQSGYMPSVVTKMMVDGPLTATDLRVIKENMIALTSLDLSHVTNLTALPERQFEESLLTEIVLPSNLESIGDYAFNSCRLLELTELPASVKTIGDNAFSSCPKVNLKALPASLEKIGGYAFSGTGMLEVIAGEVLAEVGEGAFRDCKLLERVDLEATSLTEITDMAFSGCSELDEVILPPTVETIGSSTFSGTAIRNIDFASGVTEIGNYAFSNNRRLVSATLPKTLTTVGEGLFADCPRLISLSMPNVVTGVGSKIVSNDRKLASLSCSAPDAPEAATGAFDDVRYRYVTLTIPTLSFRNYLSAAQWGKFESTQNSIKVNMGKGLSITSTAEKEYQDMLNEDALEEAQEAAAVQSGKMSPARVMRRAATRAKTTQNFATVFDGAQLMQGKEGGANRIFITPDPNVTITSILFDGQELLASYDGQSILLPEGKSGSLEILTDAPSTYSITASSSDKAKGAVEIKGGGESVSGGSAVTVTATPVAGYEFVNWTAEGNEVSTENPYQFTVSQNIALVANFKAKKYDVKFVYGNGEEDAVKNLEFGAVIPAPENPTRTGYTFTGWNPAFEDGVTVPVDGITYTATWSINKYTISFDSDGGSEVASITLDYGSDVTVPAAPTKTGYTFKGWDKEIPAKMPAGDMSVKALWTVNKYTITYMVDNSVYKTLDVDYGSAIVAESAPEKEGYTFSGWTGLPETMPAQDVTVKGEFTVNSYTLSIYLNGELYSTKDIEYGAVLNIETPTVPQDYIFDGWTEALPETMPAHEVKIYGTYSKDPSAGVDFTLDNDSVVTVYTLSGALICKDKTWREVMQTLEKGIYIVSGKKVVIR